ncbi:homoserine dehydrogenase [Collibacillus ludicampi]|uniref:Homoserine dehydrogenase n=1 Tax=Collibacillus ludicampi TaxID=2771369 RepID=A0AAV4LID1_9BACL|nr:homoserine dehydrogenase [Collibacillus ludicampi]GIM47187.1 homoserine dehydrogenase [Collibacillus ludicampi]
MKQVFNIGLLGLGTVGSGVYKILTTNAEDLAQRAGAALRVAAVAVRDKEKKRLVDVPEELLTTDAFKVATDPGIDILVEVMGGIEGTKDLLLTALKSGKSVVTANKDLIAEHGEELFAVAKENGCDLLFEASVGGGIPIIRPLKQCLAGNRITQVMGIINGTTNFMLTRMTQTGATFEEALKEAQELGYAEADPTSDVKGYDAARKMAILASLAFNSRVTFSDVDVEGIDHISDRDIAYARDLGYTIKLLGVAEEETDGEIGVCVYPALVPNEHPLASVNGAYNAIFVRGDAIGEAMFLGLGAGQMPTASAVTGDIVEAVRNLLSGANGSLISTCYHNKKIKDTLEAKRQFYLRLEVSDLPGVLSVITGILGRHGVSIQSLLQKRADSSEAEIVIITHEGREHSVYDSLAELRELKEVKAVQQVLRVIE